MGSTPGTHFVPEERLFQKIGGDTLGKGPLVSGCQKMVVTLQSGLHLLISVCGQDNMEEADLKVFYFFKTVLRSNVNVMSGMVDL